MSKFIWNPWEVFFAKERKIAPIITSMKLIEIEIIANGQIEKKEKKKIVKTEKGWG